MMRLDEGGRLMEGDDKIYNCKINTYIIWGYLSLYRGLHL